MVKSETRRDAEILVRNPSPRLFGKKFRDSKKVKTNHAKTRLIKNASEISRSCQNFPRPTFFEVPFATPHFFRLRLQLRLFNTFRSVGSSENRIVGVGSRSGRINQSQCTFPRFMIGLVLKNVLRYLLLGVHLTKESVKYLGPIP